MNAESQKQKGSDLSAEDLKVLELGGIFKKAFDELEDLKAEEKAHLWEAENLKTSRIPTSVDRLSEAQRNYDQAIKEAKK